MEPVIIVPGLMGSVITTVKDDTQIWPAVTYSTLKRLSLNQNGSQRNDDRAIATDIIRTAAGRGIYAPIIQFFVEKGYREGTDLFTFPYDWRLDVAVSARNLASVIELARSSAKSEQVNIVAHSMGGLVSSQFLTAAEDNDRLINNLVMVGSPLVGAPKAYLSLRFGKDSPIPWFVPFSPSEEEFRSIVGNMPGAYQLLPSLRWEAFNGQGFVKKGDKVLSVGDTYTTDADQLFNVPMAERALEFHQTIDRQRDRLKHRAFLLMGTGLDTVKFVNVDHNFNFQSTDANINGDATVLNLGLRDYIEPRSTLLFDEVEHLELIRNRDVLNVTYNIIKNGFIS